LVSENPYFWGLRYAENKAIWFRMDEKEKTIMTDKKRGWLNSSKFRMYNNLYKVLASSMKRRLIETNGQFYLQERPFYFLAWVTTTVTSDELLAWASFGKRWKKF